ncbi:TetR/AcrR family transcriptional regulator [Streptosporangium sp. NPDC051023]|uniref:TetR/AcrR family transcriptional regulator n=1 Tax=Streptosporangium sp. NPDC051023 TaxID=3155410 RepID=UPI003450F9DA
MSGEARNEGRRGRGRGARQNRAETEAALMEAALRILERDGVLAGLSLQEVADEAGVNRGLIHHYFGGRQALLRAALESRRNAGAERFARVRSRLPEEKEAWAFRVHARDATYPRVVTLLALDGDEEFEPLAYLGQRVEDLERETAEGRVPPGIDLPALLVLWDSFMYGYFVMRPAIARQLGVTEAELDRRVMATFALLTGRSAD